MVELARECFALEAGWEVFIQVSLELIHKGEKHL